MKTKLFFFFLVVTIHSVFAQSILLTPNQAAIKTTSATAEIDIKKFGGTPTIVGRSSGGTAASPSNTQLYDNLFRISAAGYVGGIAPYYTSSSIDFVSSANWTNTVKGSNIQFSTTENGTTNRKLRMTIKHSGELGVGTDDPRAKMHILNGGDTSRVNLNQNYFYYPTLLVESDTISILGISSPPNKKSGIYFGSDYLFGANNTGLIHNPDTTFSIKVGAAEVTFNGRTGNIGIGNTEPEAKLSIEGDFAFSTKEILMPDTTYDNFNRNGKSVLKVQGNPTGMPFSNVYLSGLTGGIDGVFVHIYLEQNARLFILHNHSSASSQNRILTHTNSDLTIESNGGLTLIYDAGISKWRIVGIAN
ncbi:MAG: hypothetical protein ACRCVT_09060 [Leadbetterella sp.]